MLTIILIKLLSKVKSAFWLHLFYYAIPFTLGVLFVVFSLNFSDKTAFLISIQSFQGIASVIVLILTAVGFIRFWYYHTLNKLYDRSVITDSYGTSTNVGQPGDGKSSVSVYDSYINACYNWSELRKEYYFCDLQLLKWQVADNTSKLEHCKEVFEAYEFYSGNEETYIPCLHSNITVTDKFGRQSYSAPITVYEQRLRLPYMAVCFVDEIGQETNLNVDIIKQSRNLRVSHFFRFVRQFCAGKIFATEQDPKNIYIDVRRNAKNRYMLGQHSALKPAYFGFLLNFLAKWGMKKNINNPFFVGLLLDLKRLNYIMGYRVFRFVYVGNTELGNYTGRKIITRAIPYYTDFTYDDRYFRRKYMAKEITSDFLKGEKDENK